MANLEIWQYYLREELRYGPSYDIEIVQLDSQQEEELEATDGTAKSSRRQVTLG